MNTYVMSQEGLLVAGLGKLLFKIVEYSTLHHLIKSLHIDLVATH
jgi:hypothetical protein